MCVTALRAPVGGWVHDHLKSLITGPSLLGNCCLENKYHKNLVEPHPPPPSYDSRFQLAFVYSVQCTRQSRNIPIIAYIILH